MRNLELIEGICLPCCGLLNGPRCLTVDVDTGMVWTVDRNGLFSLSTGDKEFCPIVPIMDSGQVSPGARFVGVQYIPDTETICIAVSTGEVLTYSLVTNELECVGVVGGGITCMSWSPDQEVVVFATGLHNLILMNKDFDPIVETALHTTEAGEAEPVSVGWGKKETQFHGSVGKAERNKKSEPVSPCFPWDDGKVRISWKGDGQHFVCSSVSPRTGARQLSVWTRECSLYSTSENVDGVEQSLHWRPAGNLIATSQRLSHRHDIVFFEPNGLQHGQFTLTFSTLEMKVKEIEWNCDSSVLALWLESLKKEEVEAHTTQPQRQSETREERTIVQLWCVNNYHWYLKQEVFFDPRCGDDLALFSWDPIEPYKLHLLTKSGQYMRNVWRWTVSQSIAPVPHNSATVAVIDGAQLLLTPFRSCVVPPPMSAHQVPLPATPSFISFGPPEVCNDFIVFMCDGHVQLFVLKKESFVAGEEKRDEQGFRVVAEGPVMAGSGRVPPLKADSIDNTPTKCPTLRHTSWWRQDTVLAVCWSVELQKDCLVVYTLTSGREGAGEELTLEERASFPCSHPVLALACCPLSITVAVQMGDGSVYSFKEELGLLPWHTTEGLPLTFPQPCICMQVGCFNEEEVVVGLTDRNRLFFNEKEVASNCTSFFFHNEFFLFTTHSHTCRFVSLQRSIQDVPYMPSTASAALDESVRRVERGSCIVTTVPNDTRLVLQMPRGNLETIHPRALVLSCVRKALDSLEYKQAFTLMKKHRINMNLTVDHNPQAFFDHIGDFVCKLNDATVINLFLTELKNESVTETIYKGIGTGSDVTGGSGPVGGSKVDRVCDAMLTELAAQGEDKFLLSILTAHLKKTEPEIEIALRRIKHRRDHPPAASSSPTVTADEALRYILYLTDVNDLYNVALGTYDFDLVLLVAEKSQKDPKEYLPFLNQLRKLPPPYQYYTIDKHLGRYKKALQHIVACGPDMFEECVSLVKEHHLYQEALALLPKMEDQYKVVAKAYGEYLLDKKKYLEAGVAFTNAGCRPQARDAFESCLHWQQVFVLMSEMGEGEAVVMETARRMATALRSQKRQPEAARVLLDYAQDHEEAIVVLLEAWQWAESLRLIHYHRRRDLIDSHFVPALLETYGSVMETLSALSEQLDRQTARLVIVRESKMAVQGEHLLGEGADEAQDTDLFSEASSVAGQPTRSSAASTSASSSRTARSRRKAERKQFSLREGGKYEDIALMHALKEAITTVDKFQEDVSSLVLHLLLYQGEEEARQLQSAFEALVVKVEEKIMTIWPPERNVAVGSVQSALGPHATVNSIVAAATSGAGRTQAAADSTAPVPSPPASLRKNIISWATSLLRDTGLH